MLESLDDFEEDTLVDLHVYAPEIADQPRPVENVTRLVDFAELARILDRQAALT